MGGGDFPSSDRLVLNPTGSLLDKMCQNVFRVNINTIFLVLSHEGISVLLR